MMRKDGKRKEKLRRGDRPSGEKSAHRTKGTDNLKKLVGKRLPRNIVKLLHQLGAMADDRRVSIFLVGGFVRDLLLKRPNWDLDITVEGDGVEFARAVADRYGGGLALFERFSTARLVLPAGLKLDIASTRRESYVQPAALPQVKPASLSEDLYRRDFTINAMAIQLNVARYGILHDPYEGRRDLSSKRMRVLHGRSFIDDPTRIFRAIRFSERFGFALERTTARLLKEAAETNLIDQLSGPRLRNEIFLLAVEPHPDRVFSALARLNLFRFFHPGLRYGVPVKRLVLALPRAIGWWMRRREERPIDRAVLYLMALLSQTSPAVNRSIVQRLQLSHAQSSAVAYAGRDTSRAIQRLMGPEVLRPSEVYRLLAGRPDEALVLLVAAGFSSKKSGAVIRLIKRLERFVTQDRYVTPILNGEDLKRLGLTPGPRFTTMLIRLRDARLDGEVKTAADERELVRREI